METNNQQVITKGPWAWQKFGEYFLLCAQHGMREIIVSSLPVAKKPIPTYPAMNINGRLEAIDPNHPNAKLIADAPVMLQIIKDFVNEYEIFSEIPENYKDLPGYPGDENPRTLAMLKAIEIIAKYQP